MMITAERYTKIEEAINAVNIEESCEEAIEKVISMLAGEQINHDSVAELIQDAEDDDCTSVMIDSTLEGMAMNFGGLNTKESILKWFVRYEVEIYHTDQGYYITETI